MKLFLIATTLAFWASTTDAYRFEQRNLDAWNRISCPNDTILPGECMVRGWTEAHRVCDANPNCGGISQPDIGTEAAGWIAYYGPDPYMIFAKNSSFGQSGVWTVYAKQWLPAFKYYSNEGKWLKDNPDYRCVNQTLDTSKNWCIVKGEAAARAICDFDPNCGGFGQAVRDTNWMNTYPDGYALFQMVSAISSDSPRQNWNTFTKLERTDAMTKTRPQQSASYELYVSDMKVRVRTITYTAIRTPPAWPADPVYPYQTVVDDIIRQCSTRKTLCRATYVDPSGVRFSYSGDAPNQDLLNAFIKDALSSAEKNKYTKSREATIAPPDGSPTRYDRTKDLFLPRAIYGSVWSYQHDEGFKQMTGMAGGTFTLKISKDGESEGKFECPTSVQIISAIAAFIPVVGEYISGGLGVVCSALDTFNSL